MSEWFKWLRKHKKGIVLVVIFLVIGIPFLIHACFKLTTTKDFFIAEWEAGSVLEYYGAILGFLGTISLSALALYQNQMIKEESDARQRAIEKIEMEKQMPRFKVSSGGYGGCYGDMRIELENISENIANDIKIEPLKIVGTDGRILSESTYIKIDTDDLQGGKSTRIEFINKPLSSKEENIEMSFNFECDDVFRKRHRYVAVVKLEAANIPVSERFKIEEI